MESFVNIAEQSLWMVITLSIVPLVAALIVVFVIGVFQAMTQVQDQALTSIPRLITISIVVLITLPWIIVTITAFAKAVFDLMLRVGQGV